MTANTMFPALERVLDEVDAPVIFFFRDDDGGWEDARLCALLDLHERHGMPLDLALIPDALSQRIVRELEIRAGRNDALGMHQHGRAHLNHESAGRKCEFGTSRKAVDQYTDIESGRNTLADHFGGRVDPIFTPPWNRCTQVTVVSLSALGFRVVSRDRGAEDLNPFGLTELPVDVDWCGLLAAAGHRSHGEALAEIDRRLARAATRAEPVGVMLHHAVMDAEWLEAEEALLALLARHPQARCRRMIDLCAPGAARNVATASGARG
jgi:hypothetical protein